MQPAGCGDRPTGMEAGKIMHPVTATRPLARGAAALACVLAIVSGLAAAGCARSPAGAGSPVPASAISRLTGIASRAAKAGGDAAPSWMTAVLTTRAKAHTTMCEVCLRENVVPSASMKCCQDLEVPLNKAIAEHDKLMKRLADKPAQSQWAGKACGTGGTPRGSGA